jgi:predicted Zn-dependent protease
MNTAADPFALAREHILRPAGLDEGHIERALGSVLQARVDAADIYFQLARDESWSLEDGIVKEGSANIEQGVGVRALAGEKPALRIPTKFNSVHSRKPRSRRVRSRPPAVKGAYRR